MSNWQDNPARVTLIALVVFAVAVPSALAHVVALAKPTTRDFDRVQNAGFAAAMKDGLVVSRCDSLTSDDIVCISAATLVEAKAFYRAATVEKTVALKLARGSCRTAMLRRAGAHWKHRRDVLTARMWWLARNPRKATQYYFAPYGLPRAQLDGLFLKYCSR